MAAERTEKPATDAADHELVRRFARNADEAAFEEMVRRHGALVLGVCRRVLGPGHDLEDAFQATFLVLAQSARKIRRKASLASWLYGVAYRVALKEAKRRYAARGEPLGEVVANADDPFDRMSRRHEERALDEELYALREKYRRPLVLHYLEGRTNKDIAGVLGLSVSAVEGRLKRAKDQLRRRLVRRGITLTVLGAVAGWSQAARAGVSASLVRATVEASVSYVAGNACGGSLSHQLAQSEVTAMASTAKTVGALAAMSAVVACVGVWSAATFGVGQEAGAADAALAATAEAAGETESSAPAAVKIEKEPAKPASRSGYGSSRYTPPNAQQGSQRYPYGYSGPAKSSQSRQQKAVEEITAALDKELKAAPPQKSLVLEEFAQFVAKELDVPVVLDHRALEDVGMIGSDTLLEVDLPETGLSGRSVLRLVLDQRDLDYVITNEVLLITTPEEAETMLETVVYSTRPLQVPAGELGQIITQTVAPDTWDEVGGPGTACILPDDESLVISQTQRVHEQIDDLLDQLRRNTVGPAPTARARTTAEGTYGMLSDDGRAGMIEKRPAAPRPHGSARAGMEGTSTVYGSRSVSRGRGTRKQGDSLPAKRAEPMLRISFRYQPWKDVLEWFASTQSLSLVMDAPPPGVFNYTDPQPKSPQEIMELLNSILLVQGHALVVQDKKLLVLQLQRPERGAAGAGELPPAKPER